MKTVNIGLTIEEAKLVSEALGDMIRDYARILEKTPVAYYSDRIAVASHVRDTVEAGVTVYLADIKRDFLANHRNGEN